MTRRPVYGLSPTTLPCHLSSRLLGDCDTMFRRKLSWLSIAARTASCCQHKLAISDISNHLEILIIWKSTSNNNSVPQPAQFLEKVLEVHIYSLMNLLNLISYQKHEKHSILMLIERWLSFHCNYRFGCYPKNMLMLPLIALIYYIEALLIPCLSACCLSVKQIARRH